MTRSTAIVFGGTSYVGSYAIGDLLELGYRVIAITRRPWLAKLFLGERVTRVEVVQSGERVLAGPLVDVVLNLAYVKQSQPHMILRESRALVRSMHRCAVELNARRLVHVSTLAVFGYRPTVGPRLTAAPNVRGDAYMESKAYEERLLSRWGRASKYALSIVRLGNVVGPGAPAWVARLAQRVLEGRAFPARSEFGASNSTCVQNTANYLAFVASTDPGALRAWGLYHHVAELADVGWSELLDGFTKVMGMDAMFLPPGWSAASLGGLAGDLVPVLRKLYRGRLGSWARSIARSLPARSLFDSVWERAKELHAAVGHLAEPDVRDEDRAVFETLTCQVKLSSHTLPTWRPPVSREEALHGIAQWLVETGYSVGQRLSPPRRPS